MAMSDAEFEALVARLEEVARQRPATYKRKVLGLAVLGYGYVLLVLGILVAALVLLGFLMVRGRALGALVKVVGLLIILIWVVLRALWVRLEAPQGLRLTPERAPRLFAELEALRQALDAPPLHAVLLTRDFNASIAQVPRLGVLGWHRNYLSLGLPLLQALSADQLRAVLAHEWGHLSRTHGRFGAWIYRIRLTWLRLMEELDRRGRGQLLFKRFFAWYAPLFGAYSFVLARAQEYEADRHAAELAGAGALAGALVRIHVTDAFLNGEFWPRLYRRAVAEPQPPPVLRELGESLAQHEGVAADASRLAAALAAKRDPTDTHPALSERLAALGEEAALPPPPEESAAAHYLGAALPELTAALESEWHAEAEQPWRERHEEAARERQRLDELAAKAAVEELALDEAWERAQLAESVAGEEAAMPLYRELLARQPGHAEACFALGRLLLARGDAEGADLLRRAAESNYEAGIVVASLLSEFYATRGDEAEAEAWRERLRQGTGVLEQAAEERNTLRTSDRLIDHGLPPEAVAAIAAQLAHHSEVAAAYLARKEVQHLPDHPLYVLGVQLPWRRGESYHTEVCRRLAAELTFPGECFVISVSTTGELGKGLRRLAGAEVYRRR